MKVIAGVAEPLLEQVAEAVRTVGADATPRAPSNAPRAIQRRASGDIGRPGCRCGWLLCQLAELWRRRGRRDAEAFFFFFLDDDPRRNHHHQAVGFAADADVAEEPIDVRQLSREAARRIRCGLRRAA